MSPTRPKTQPPRIDALRLDGLRAGDPDDLDDSADLEAVHYTDLTLAALPLRGAVVSAARFTGLAAPEADLRGARLSEVELDRVHLPVVRAARTQWRDVRISGRLGGVESYEAQWRSVHVDGAKLDYLNLRGAELTDVAFTDCVVGELDLLQAVVRRVRFTRTRVAHLNVQHAELHDLDLRGADLETIEGLTHLRGATVSHPQLMLLAPLLAEQIGLRIED